MRRAFVALGVTVVVILTTGIPGSWADPAPAGTVAPAATAAAAASPPSDGGVDDHLPIPADELADMQARAQSYRAGLAGQARTNGTAAAVNTPSGMPFVGSATLWCTYSNPGSPGNYCSGYHPYPALDIAMPPGTPVIAAGDGQVVAAVTTCTPGNTSCGGQAGNYVSITHPDGRFSRYMHMTSVSVRVGQNVSAGTQLGLSGWTGNVQPDTAATAHLHYEEDNSAGTAIDPGEMTGCRSQVPYNVLANAGVSTWNRVTWGTVLTNDNTCGGQVVVSPPPPPPPTGPTPPPWSSVFGFGGATASRPAVGINADGRQEVFVVGPYGLLMHTWQGTPNGFWSNWEVMDTTIAFPASSIPAVATNADGRLEVFVLGNDGSLWHTYQTAPNSGWPRLSSLSGSSTGNPSVARNADGRLELFARNSNGSMWHMWQGAPNSGWAGWYPLGGMWPATTTLATPTNKDGRVELFAIGTDGGIWHAWQGTPSGGFSPFMSIGGQLTPGAPISVTSNLDGRLDVFSSDSSSTLWHISQTSAGGAWGSFTSLGSGWRSQPAVLRDRSGRINVAAMGTNGQLGIIVQDGANNGYRAAVFLGGSGTTKPVLNPNADGHVEAYFTGTDAALDHAWQMAVPS